MPPRGLLCLASLIILAALLALASPSVFAQPSTLAALPLAQEAPPSEPQSADPMDRLSAYLDWIRQETRDYRDALETDRQDFVDMAHFVAWCVMGLVTLAGVVVMYTAFRNSNEIRRMMDRSAQAVETEATLRLRKFESDTRQHYDDVLAREIGAVRTDLATLRSTVQRERGFHDSRVLMLAAGAEWSPDLVRVERELDRLGLRVTRAPLDEAARSVRGASLVVYHLQDSSVERLDAGLGLVIGALQDLETVVPLVIYFSSAGRVEGKNDKAIKDYLWATFANSAPALVNQIFTSLLTLSSVRETAGG